MKPTQNHDYAKQAERVFLLMALIAAVCIVLSLCQGASYQLVWNSKETTNTVYEIWRGTNATGPFSPWAIVAETRAPMPTGEPMGFFIVRASNTVTHKVSDWSSR
jgi:hypothetical protein